MSEHSTESYEVQTMSEHSTESYSEFYSGRPSDRVAELSSQVSALIDQVQADGLGFGNRSDILEALKEFQLFFEAYNGFFNQQWVADRCARRGRTHDSVLNAALDKTREAWATLNWAINQRHNPLYAARLAQADAKAGEYCRRFKGLLKYHQPIIYFDKLYHLIRFPYRFPPLLAIPLDGYNESDWSPVAHELGHYVFWNSGNLNQYYGRMVLLRQTIAGVVLGRAMPELDLDDPAGTDAATQKLCTWLSWAEETFADIFGTLLIGPMYAKNAQDLQLFQMITTRDDLVADDHEHPMPFLRPLIAIEVLATIAAEITDDDLKDRVNEVVKALRSRWRPYHQVGETFTDQDYNHGHAIEVPVKPGELDDYVKDIVAIILHGRLFLPLEGIVDRRWSLLSLVEYWGKNDKRAAIADIQETLQKIALERLPDLPGLPADPDPSFIIPQATMPPAGNPVADLLAYIQARREERRKKGGTLDSEEWEDLLALELGAEFGYNTSLGKPSHGHYELAVRHTHPDGLPARRCP